MATDIVLTWVAQTILVLGYPGIAFLMMLESIILPLPSEAILPFAGYLASTGLLDFWLVVVAATVGSLVGSYASYTFGRYGGRPFLREYGRYLFVHKRHLALAQRWFSRYGERVVFFGRLLPVVRHFISIPAGIARMRTRMFLMYTAMGAFVWNLILTGTGFLLAEQWERIAEYTVPLEIALVVIVFFSLVWYVGRAIERRAHVLKRLRESDAGEAVQEGIERVQRTLRGVAKRRAARRKGRNGRL